jgi:hypothetical protein
MKSCSDRNTDAASSAMAGALTAMTDEIARVASIPGAQAGLVLFTGGLWARPNHPALAPGGGQDRVAM